MDAVYDRIAAEHAALVPAELEDVPWTVAIATRALVAALGDVAGARLLDLGCGEGHVARRVRAMGGAVAGVDASGELLRLARERSPGVEFLGAGGVRRGGAGCGRPPTSRPSLVPDRHSRADAPERWQR